MEDEEERRSELSPPVRGANLTMPKMPWQSSSSNGVPLNVLSRSKTLKKFGEQNVEQIFHRFAGKEAGDRDSQCFFTVDRFRQVLIEELGLPLASFEIDRLFEHLDYEKRGYLSLEQFVHCIKRWRWLRRILVDSNFPNQFYVPNTFDYSKSTVQNYKADHPVMVGDHQEVRWQMWHHGMQLAFHEERQLWQDALIKAACSKTDHQPRPKIIYTLGGETVDHSYLMTWLSEMNIVPLEFVVRVNGGSYAEMMPEWQQYCEQNSGNHSKAKGLCDMECAYLEVLTREVALLQAQHVWVDATLSSTEDADWPLEMNRTLRPEHIEAIRSRFPNYHISVLSVNKQPPPPAGELLCAPKELPEWLSSVDVIAHIDVSDPEDPLLMRVEDMSGSWHRGLGRHFKEIHEQPGGFPYALATLQLKTIPLDALPDTHLDFQFSSLSGQTRPTATAVSSGESPAKKARATPVSPGDHPPTAPVSSSDVAQEARATTASPRPTLARSNTILRKLEGSQGGRPPARPWRKKTLITACSANSAPTPLVLAESEAIRRLVGADTCQAPRNNSPQRVTSALKDGVQCWHVACHQDAVCQGNPTLGLTDENGEFALLSTELLVGLLSKCSVLRGGSLELVVLNGCSSQAIAERLSQLALVPYVVCWATRVEDHVAALFAEGFWEAVVGGESYEGAFESGQLRVETELVDGFLDGEQRHIKAMVPKYKLGVDPDDPNQVYEKVDGDQVTRVLQRDVHAQASYPRIAAGIVRLVSHKIGAVGRAVKGTLVVKKGGAKELVRKRSAGAMKRRDSVSSPRTPRTLRSMEWKVHEDFRRLEETQELRESLRVIFEMAQQTVDAPQDPFLGATGNQRLPPDAAVQFELILSPKNPVNLDFASREDAGIPMSAKYFSWLYPVTNLDAEQVQRHCRGGVVSSLLSLLCYGGYLYFDEDLQVCAANAVMGIDCLSRFTIRFGDYEPLAYEDAATLTRAGRWHPVTLKALKDAGAQYFAWILPREQLSSQRHFPKFGAFAYLFRRLDDLVRDPRDRFFPIEEQ